MSTDDSTGGDSTGERRTGGPRPLGAVVQRVSKRALGRRGFAEATLVTEWATLVGAALAEGSQPERLSFPPSTRRDGTLTIRVAGGTATELQHLGPQLLERINGHFGYRAVARLRFVQAPLAKPSGRRARRTAMADGRAAVTPLPHADLSQIESDALRAALERLGSAIATAERDGRSG